MSGSNWLAFSFFMRPRWVLLLASTLMLILGGCLERPVSGADGQDGENTLAMGLATLPSQFAEATVASGISNPTALALVPDGRILVCQQGGQLRVIKNGSLLSAPALTVTVNTQGERGLLGVAVDPAFSSNKFLYVHYTSTSGSIHGRVSRFTMNGDVAGSETVLLNLPTQSAIYHIGGAIHFGQDGKLYIAVGDNKNGNNAQNRNSVFGKILRINSDGSIPSDNPFYSANTGIGRAVWVYGLRNPFTFAFQPGTAKWHINDVGEASWEEINDGVKGSNYGWPTSEGSTSNAAFRGPIFTYSRSSPNCAVIGGAFYNPATRTFPSDYAGDYLFGDYCGGTIRRRDAGGSVAGFASGISSLVDIAVANDGSVYYLQRGGGGVLKRITYTGSSAPSIAQHPANATVSVGGSATFTVQANGSGLSYQWQRNNSNISGAASASYTRSNAQSADNGSTYRCVVSNSAGSATSNAATLTVTSNQPPMAAIQTPASGTTYSGGQTISYSGTGTDPENGSLAGSAFTWKVDFHHDAHSHPFMVATTGAASGSFTIPRDNEVSDNVFYRIHLTVKDAGGLTHTVTRDVAPKKASITVASNPSGLTINLDGQPRVTPFTFTGVVGVTRGLEAVSPQASGGKTYAFSSWSDGGARSHSVNTPASATTYTATFAVSGSAIYEAESAVLSGPVISNIHAGYTGTGFIDFKNLSGDYAEFTVNAAAAGSNTLQFRYSNGSGTTRTLRVTINGGQSRDITFPATSTWKIWQTLNTTATLNAGSNKVRAATIGSEGPNTDHLSVF